MYNQQPKEEKLISYSRTLRKEMTEVERKLWRHLQQTNSGYKFRRQHSIGSYIVDFVCLDKKLIIECDGSQHMEQEAYDKIRDQFLKAQGFTVLRFWNNEITQQMDGVLKQIHRHLSPEEYERVQEKPSPY